MGSNGKSAVMSGIQAVLRPLTLWTSRRPRRLAELAASVTAPLRTMRAFDRCSGMKVPRLFLILCLLAAAAAPGAASPVERPLVLAQGGFTFGSRDDLGPRYDPYSERWGRPEPADPRVCRWVAVRTPQPDGRVVLRRQRQCGFRVPARE